MSGIEYKIPPFVLRVLEEAPADRSLVMLVRHSVREALPPGDAGYVLPITGVGHELAIELGTHLRGRLTTLHTSPLVRCVQTAEALAKGAGSEIAAQPDRLLGDPGVFVVDGGRAGENWNELSHEGVMHHLVSETSALPAMARPDEAARFLVQSMLGVAAGRPGVHVFVTHDSLVTATAARLLSRPLGVDDWPHFLGAAFFWATAEGVHTSYRAYEGTRSGALCGLGEHEVIEFARREVAGTIGLDSGARFFLAGGAFKSLLTGLPPRDLDIWAPSARDRALVIEALRSRGARSAGERPYADAFEIGGRVVEVPKKVVPETLAGRLTRFDLALSAIGVEHLPHDVWSAMVHPLALESVARREVRLLKPLVNWRHALATLERMRRYAAELSYDVPADEEAEIWRVFDAQDEAMRAGMLERYEQVGSGGFGVREELASRLR